MLKILFPLVGDSVGGSHWSTINLYKELSKKEDISPILVLHISNGPLSSFLDSHNIPYKNINTKVLAGSSPNLFSIIFSIISNFYLTQRFIKSNNIDVVHGNDLRVNLTWSFATLFTPSKYVWHQRQVLSKSIKWRFIRHLSNHLISISNYVHDSLPDNIKLNFASCINNPFDVSNLYQKKYARNKINSIYGISNSSVLIGYVGRLTNCKHVDDILYALSNIVSSNSISNIHLLIVGTGDNSYIERLTSIINSEKIGKHVTMTGFTNNPSLTLASLDLLIASSYNEPFGRVLVEAMLQKTLVLASASGGHNEIVVDKVNGFLYTYPFVESMSNMIVKITLKHIDNKEIIEGAYNFSVKKYSMARHAQQVVSIYNNLMESK